MVAAICHAWLLGYRQKENEGGSERAVVGPVMNVMRSSMWKLKQAAWLFHHAALDANALLFTNEMVDCRLVQCRHVDWAELRRKGFKGTRFRPLSFNVPKPLFPLARQPMVHHPISACKRFSTARNVG
ncbi:hypothetical protein JHK87_006956 [Glycine soja]|nr:hypothetical protein JHK87_006956 [Glycine soja]